MAEDILRSHLDAGAGAGVPWRALRYLVSDATYGGRVTDEVDRRVLAACIGRLFSVAALETPSFKLGASPAYCCPADGSLASHRSHIAALPATDPPEALGQHANAELSQLIHDAGALLDGLVAVAGCAGAAVDGHLSRDMRQNVVAGVAAELLETVGAVTANTAGRNTTRLLGTVCRQPPAANHPSTPLLTGPAPVRCRGGRQGKGGRSQRAARVPAAGDRPLQRAAGARAQRLRGAAARPQGARRDERGCGRLSPSPFPTPALFVLCCDLP